MMSFGRILGAIALITATAACGGGMFGGGPDCGSDEAQKQIDELLKEELEFAIQSDLDSKKELGSYDATELEDAVKRIKIKLEDVRTSRDDPDSSRMSCRATLAVDLPKAVESDANEALAMAELGSVREIANRYKIKRRGGKYASDFDYFIQPTDDGSKLLAEIDDDARSLEFLGEVLASYLLADEIREEKIEADKALAEEQRQEREAIEAEQAMEREATQAFNAEGAAALNAAQVERKLASESINAIWDAMPQGAQSDIEKLHDAWVGQMKARCAAQAAGTDQRASMRKASELQCQTNLVRSCANTLRRNLDNPRRWSYCSIR